MSMAGRGTILSGESDQWNDSGGHDSDWFQLSVYCWHSETTGVCDSGEAEALGTHTLVGKAETGNAAIYWRDEATVKVEETVERRDGEAVIGITTNSRGLVIRIWVVVAVSIEKIKIAMRFEIAIVKRRLLCAVEWRDQGGRVERNDETVRLKLRGAAVVQ